MRSIIAIFFLMLFAATESPLGQLLKLPVLIEHFQKHKKQDKVSFLKFLNDHYSKEHRDADQPEDEQLPFKTVMLQTVGFAIVPNILISDFSLNFDFPRKIIPQDVYVPQQHLCRIFHPPRV